MNDTEEMAQIKPATTTGGAHEHSPVVAVLGAGSWGTALAHLISRKAIATRLWTRDEETARCLTQAQENVKYLPGTSLQNITISAALPAVLQGVNWIVAAVPCAAVPELADRLRER